MARTLGSKLEEQIDALGQQTGPSEIQVVQEKTQSPTAISSAATPGDDIIVGTPGNDEIFALTGNDTVIGLGGDDQIFGGLGLDDIVAGGGNDFVDGGTGIFFESDLIGIVAGVLPSQLSLDSDNFVFV